MRNLNIQRCLGRVIFFEAKSWATLERAGRCRSLPQQPTVYIKTMELNKQRNGAGKRRFPFAQLSHLGWVGTWADSLQVPQQLRRAKSSPVTNR